MCWFKVQLGWCWVYVSCNRCTNLASTVWQSLLVLFCVFRHSMTWTVEFVGECFNCYLCFILRSCTSGERQQVFHSRLLFWIRWMTKSRPQTNWNWGLMGSVLIFCAADSFFCWVFILVKFLRNWDISCLLDKDDTFLCCLVLTDSCLLALNINCKKKFAQESVFHSGWEWSNDIIHVYY